MSGNEQSAGGPFIGMLLADEWGRIRVNTSIFPTLYSLSSTLCFMLDVHPAHHAATTWRDFFIHIATIALGLLLAIGLEQTVEFFHHRHQASEARENIQREAAENVPIMQHNLQLLAADLQQLSKDLDLLNSGAPDAETLPQLQYAWHHLKEHDAAWDAARINGSLALIPSDRIAQETYFYESRAHLETTIYDYFKDVDTAAAIADHAKIAGKITASDRQQLLSLTASAMGCNKLISRATSTGIRALQSNSLQ